MASTYQIADEPRPSGISHLAVNPIWPFFAVMFVGAWFAWPWFILNGYALGSPTRKKELWIVLGGVAGAAVIGFLALGILGSFESGEEARRYAPYLGVLFIAWRLAVTYWLHLVQASTFGLYQYYGGTVRNGMGVVFVAALLGDRLASPLFESLPFLHFILG